MSTASSISKETPKDDKNKFSFRDFIPKIKLTPQNKTQVDLAKYVKRRLTKYKNDHGARSNSHAVHMLIEENATLRQICFKLNIAIKRAREENNVNFMIRIFDELATSDEKNYYNAINKGLFD